MHNTDVEKLRPPHLRGPERHADDVRALQRDHLAPVGVLDRVDRVQAEAGGQPAVPRGRGAAALHVAEHRGARLLAGALLDLRGQPLADAAEADVAEGVDLLVEQDLVALLRGCALGDHDDRRVLGLEAGLDPVADLLDVVLLLGDEDDVGAAGDAGVQRDPASVPAHDLDDQHPVVRLGRGVQPVDRLGGDGHRGVEAEGVVGGVQVVVDGLRHADHLHALAVQRGGHAERVLAADGDQGVHPEVRQVLLDPRHAALDLHRVGAGGAEDRAAAGQDAAHGLDLERPGQALERTAPAVAEADELVAVLLDAFADHRPDDGVQAGAVAPAGEHSDAHVVPFGYLFVCRQPPHRPAQAGKPLTVGSRWGAVARGPS